MVNNIRCMTDECRAIAASNCRGLCMKCYSKAKKMVESNQTTWEQLEEVGLVQPSDDPFTKAAKAKLAEIKEKPNASNS